VDLLLTCKVLVEVEEPQTNVLSSPRLLLELSFLTEEVSSILEGPTLTWSKTLDNGTGNEVWEEEGTYGPGS
jgi:hypothetical protein